MLQKTPKGTLIIIGGAEDKEGEADPEISTRNRNFVQNEILLRLIPPNGSKKSVEIITTASSVPDEISKMYQSAFSKLGCKKVGFITMGNSYDAANPIFIERIKKSYSVLFCGGDQFRLSTILGNSDVLAAVLHRYFADASFLVAGTSAGAMAAGVFMMFEGENNEAIIKGTVKISSGLGFIDNCIIDTHFARRGRFGRLAQAIVMNPTCVGIGLGEDTALVITKGRDAICIGSGMVVVIDGRKVGHTNMAYAKNGEPICIENMQVHVLCKGNGFNFAKRTFVPSEKDIQIEENLS